MSNTKRWLEEVMEYADNEGISVEDANDMLYGKFKGNLDFTDNTQQYLVISPDYNSFKTLQYEGVSGFINMINFLRRTSVSKYYQIICNSHNNLYNITELFKSALEE